VPVRDDETLKAIIPSEGRLARKNGTKEMSMTSTAGGDAPRPGWYADPAGSSQLRWWDGTQWTHHLQPPAAPPAPAASDAPGQTTPAQTTPAQTTLGQPTAAQAPIPSPAPVYHEDQTRPNAGAPRFIDPAVYASSAPVQPSLTHGASIYTPFMWLIVLLPLLSVIALAAFNLPIGLVARGGYAAQLHNPLLANPMLTDPTYIVMVLLGWVIYGVSVWMAYLDWRALGRMGIVHPFHWAWTFLGGLVYVIGRSVVVHRRVGGGLLPIWISAGVVVVTIVVAMVKLVSWFSSLMVLYHY
jgi:hypothetical protein